jgi:hypothetical protein
VKTNNTMTTASFDFETVDEIDSTFIRALKSLFRGQKIKVTVEAEDSYDAYLSANPAVKELLEERQKSPITHSFANVDELLTAINSQ